MSKEKWEVVLIVLDEIKGRGNTRTEAILDAVRNDCCWGNINTAIWIHSKNEISPNKTYAVRRVKEKPTQEEVLRKCRVFAETQSNCSKTGDELIAMINEVLS